MSRPEPPAVWPRLWKLLLGAAAILAMSSCGSGSTSERLLELGGEPCPDSEFTCIVLTVPMDQFAPDDRTIELPFAVLPASGERRGVIVTLVGGPGGSGIEASTWQADWFSTEIRQHFDLVYFDQRGVGMFEDDVCPEADERYDAMLGDDLDWTTEVSTLHTYLDTCFLELGNPEVLSYLGTDQAVRDLESFRRVMGYDTMVLVGESYGTQFAQTYATEFPESVERVVLDGTIDLTRNGIQAAQGEIEGFAATLDAALGACKVYPDCRDDLGGPAAEVYRSLYTRLLKEPATVEYIVGPDVWEDRTFTADDLSNLAHQMSYSEFQRTLFLRALGAAATRNDLTSLAELAETEWFDAPWLVHGAIGCLDMSLPGPTYEAELESIAEARAAVAAPDRWIFDHVAWCAGWPDAGHDREPAEPFTAAGIPTLVIASNADPATPYRDGVAVSEQAEQGHLLTVTGGSHVMFGRGLACVDEPVTQFLLDGTLPDVSSCSAALIDTYVPLPKTDWQDPTSTIESFIDDILSQPVALGWDGTSHLEIACPHGGSITATSRAALTEVTIRSCGFTGGVEVFGKAEFDSERGVTYVDILSATGTECSYRYREDWDTEERTVTERCEGDTDTRSQPSPRLVSDRPAQVDHVPPTMHQHVILVDHGDLASERANTWIDHGEFGHAHPAPDLVANPDRTKRTPPHRHQSNSGCIEEAQLADQARTDCDYQIGLGLKTT